MSATLGSLALAGVMQSTGAVATETVGNVLFVDFVAGTVIPQYAAATGTTAAAVEAGIASGVTIGTGGLILIGAAALAIIAGIIAWWISTHPKLENTEDPINITSLNFYDLNLWGNENDFNNRTAEVAGDTINGNGGTVRINDEYTLKLDDWTWNGTSTMVEVKWSVLKGNITVFNSTELTGAPTYFDHYFPIVFTVANPNNNPYLIAHNKRTMKGSSIPFLWDSVSVKKISDFLKNAIGGNPITENDVNQKKKQNALEIPQLDPNQELAINTGAATFELPNPNKDEIKKYMDEQVNNPAADPAKGFNYQPPFEVKDVQLPNPKPGDIPITPPVPAPEIPSEPVTPPNLPVQGSTSSGMVRLWNPTAAEMGEISKFMLSGDFIDQVVKLFSDPADYLLSLSLQPITPSVSAKEAIYIGSLPVPNITVSPITSQYATVDFGSIEIPAVYNSFVDYDTQFSIFLPCIGEQPLNTQDMIGSTIHLQYNVDVLTGTFAALLRVTRSTNGVNLDAVLYQWQGNLAAQIPIRASSWNVGITDIAAGALAGAAGGPYGALAGAGVALGKGLLKPRISGSGSLSGNAGLLGIQYPYLIINRPRTATPSNYKDYSGVSTSEVSRLGDLSGYTMVQDTHLQGIPATSDELDEILSLLKGGVIL